MIVAGCDVGSLTAKAVIMDDDNIISHAVMLAKIRPAESAEAVMEVALKEAGVSGKEIQFAVGTGYGKDHVPFVQRVESEILCHARGWMKTEK